MFDDPQQRQLLLVTALKMNLPTFFHSWFWLSQALQCVLPFFDSRVTASYYRTRAEEAEFFRVC